VIRNLIKFVEHDLLAHNTRAVLELDPELPLIQMSRDHLTQVLLNLVKNAQEAMPTGGTIRIKTAPWPGGVTISVLDEGVGIPEAHLNLVFDPFFSTKQDGTGMGLGLAVSYGLIASYGGSIEVASQPGKGTVFRLVLAANPVHTARENWDATGNLPEDTRKQYTWRQEVS
jgi:signal transduction histidine kinase